MCCSIQEQHKISQECKGYGSTPPNKGYGLPARCDSQLQPIDFITIHAFKCSYRKTVGMIDGGLLQDASCIKVYIVLSAMHFIAETWKLLTPTALKNGCIKCGCPVDISALVMMYRNLVKMKKVTGIVCTVFRLSTSKVCGVQIVIQVLDQQLTASEEELSSLLEDLAYMLTYNPPPHSASRVEIQWQFDACSDCLS